MALSKKMKGIDFEIPIPKSITLKISIDFLLLYLRISSINPIREALNADTGISFNRQVKKGNSYISHYSVHLIKKYGFTLESHPIQRKMGQYAFFVRLQHPDTEAVEYVDRLLKINNIDHNISCIEISLDFLTKDPKDRDKMYELMKIHLFQKWQRTSFEPGYYGTTYLGNIRKTKSKACRIYTKDFEDGRKSARLEMDMKRNTLKKNQYNIHTLHDLMTKDALAPIRDYLVFKKIDLNHFVNRLVKVRNIYMISSKPERNLKMTEVMGEVFHVIITNRSRNLYAAQKYCAEINKWAFLIDHDFNAVFMQRLENKKLF